MDSHVSPQAGHIRAQGLVIPSGLGEQKESRYTIAPASAPTGSDSQLPAARQTVHSWAPASGRGVASPSLPPCFPTLQVTIQWVTCLQVRPGLIQTIVALFPRGSLLQSPLSSRPAGAMGQARGENNCPLQGNHDPGSHPKLLLPHCATTSSTPTCQSLSFANYKLGRQRIKSHLSATAPSL